MRDVAVQNGVKGQKRVAPSLWTAGIKARVATGELETVGLCALAPV